MPNSAYWDSCVFIEALQKTNADRVDSCLDMIEKAKRKELLIITSVVTITEVNKLNELEKNTGVLPEEQSRMILDFFTNPYIHLRPVDRHTAELAHEYTRLYSLRNLDAIHVATAIISRAEVFYTWDSHKKKRRGLLGHHLKIGNPPLRIEAPPKPTPGPLFNQSDTDTPSE